MRNLKKQHNLSTFFGQSIDIDPNKYYKKFIEYCVQNKKLDMLQEINGIVVLNTIYY